MKPQSPENSGETNYSTELRGIIPSDFVGIVQLTDFGNRLPMLMKRNAKSSASGTLPGFLIPRTGLQGSGIAGLPHEQTIGV
jgi:hypothetical protein